MIAAEPSPNAFARLDPRAGWRAGGVPIGLVFGTDGVRLGEPGRAISDADASGSFGGRTLPLGVAISRVDGRLFVADPDGRCIRTMLPDAGASPAPADADPAWPLRPMWRRPAADAAAAAGDPYALVRPTDVALSPGGDLVIVDPGAGRVVVLTLPHRGVRKLLPLAGAPTSVGFDAAGRAYVVLAEATRVLRFDGDWRPDADYRGGAGTLVAPDAIAVIAGPCCHCRAADPCGCGVEADAGLPDGTVFVRDGATVVALDPRGRPTDAALPDTLAPPPLTIAADETLSWPMPPREPLRLPGLTVDRRGRLGDLTLVARPRRTVLPRLGAWIAGPFEGDADRFPWDRVVLDADIPDRTRIVVDSYADDAALSDDRVAALTDDWSVPLTIVAGDRPEVLVQSPPGRYLWLRLRFVGDGAVTPLVRALELSGPRASSLRFLPTPFHQDPVSEGFLDRLLSLFDALLDEPAAHGRGIARWLDPAAVEAGAFLDWLGGWFDWSFLAQWPQATRRDMIARAIPFFRMRGTIPGLQQLLRWHSGVAAPWPLIVEHFRLRDRAPTPPLYIGGFPLKPAPVDCAHSFTVVMPRAKVADVDQLVALIEAQKPAHTIVSLSLVEPGFRIGRQSSIGVDALIGGAPLQPLGLGRLGQNLITTGGEPPTMGAAYLMPDRLPEAVT